MLTKNYYVYILASECNGTLYLGVTSELMKRVWEHKQGTIDGFSKKHHVHDLVYYEVFEDVNEAIHREKCIKRWKRAWKLELIEKMNPEWKDLYYDLAA